MAASQGHADSQTNLGIMYAKGEGVPQSYIKAHMWFSLAKAMGDIEGGRNLAIVKGLMTPAQIAEAHVLVAEWWKTHND